MYWVIDALPKNKYGMVFLQKNMSHMHIKSCYENWAMVTKSWCILDSIHGHHKPNMKAISDIL